MQDHIQGTEVFALKQINYSIYSKEFLDSLDKEFNRLGLLLNDLTPFDPEMLINNTYEKELKSLEIKFGIERKVVQEQWDTLLELWQKIYKQKYNMTICEDDGFAVINEQAIDRIIVE